MLIPCERCKRHISTREDACPFCRHGNAFARVGAAALSAGLLFGGCDAGKGKQADQGSAVETKRPYATLRGRVTDRHGTPLQNGSLTINLVDQATGRSSSKSMPTDADGRYMFDLLEPGAYTIYFGYNNGSEEGNDNRAVTLKVGEDRTLDVVVDLRHFEAAQPYGAPPARRRVV